MQRAGSREIAVHNFGSRVFTFPSSLEGFLSLDTVDVSRGESKMIRRAPPLKGGPPGPKRRPRQEDVDTPASTRECLNVYT